MKNNLNLIDQNFYDQLQNQFYASIPFPCDALRIEEVMIAFFKFLEEPEHIKNHIDFTVSPIHRRGDVGFKHRDPNDHMYNDSKDFFHFHPAIFENYPDFLQQHPVVNDFMLKAMPIWDLVYDTIGQILNYFEPENNGLSSKVFDVEMPHIVLRFLKYNWDESGKYLAKPHFDAGSFTLGIAESCPGLRIGSNPENLKLVEHKENHAIFMISSNFRKIMNNEDLLPGWHDVIQLDESYIGKPFARWAIVAFIEADGVEALPRSETRKYYIPDVA
ncbi:MAG: hypothetical protein Q8K37_00835 [Alphaproteobacteria bacterium]|nr:hypothetical protein [Alphaproteobacteria bacterium]